MRFAKGHGTGNDFIVVPDLDDRLELGPDVVRRLCDRRTGIGADGLLRVVASVQVREVTSQAQDGGSAAPWFMDYRNSDGSFAEMCGNGIRVFARYLLNHGLETGPELTIETRAGVRVVREEPDGTLTADMGAVTVGRAGWAVISGRRYTGHAVTVGNPHLVCLVGKLLEDIDLTEPPEVDTAMFPDGVNVEVARTVGDHAIEMRVHERGSGETLSCGTGAVAAAAAAAAAVGEWPGTGSPPWHVDVPGGRLVVAPSTTTSLLTGPAVIVAEGDTNASWLDDPVVTTV